MKPLHVTAIAIAATLALGGAGFAGRATAPPPIFFTKAFVLLVSMKSNGEPRIMGIQDTPQNCKLQAQAEMRQLPVLEAPSQFDTENWVCQQVLLPTAR